MPKEMAHSVTTQLVKLTTLCDLNIKHNLNICVTAVDTGN